MRNFICFVIFLVLLSCNNDSQQKEPFKSLLKKCDEVKFNFYNGGDTLHFQTKDSLGIKYLVENIKGSTETINDTCKPAGDIYYTAGNDTLLRAQFAIMPAGNRKDCAYISYNYQNNSYKNRISEKIYQLLTQMYPKPSADTIQRIDSTQLKDSFSQTPDSTRK
jgi:hypothetical protein